MNNEIAFVAQKNKIMAHSMILNNRISCVVGISIFGFKKYWMIFFSLIELNTSPTLKQFLQDKKYNADKKIILSMMQCKKIRAFHK